MKKTIQIGNEKIEMTASAGTPIKYRNQFKEDLLKKFAEMSENNDGDIEVFQKLAYIMASPKEDFIDWLDKFELFDFIEAVPEITELWTGNSATEEIAIKNVETAEDK